MSRSNAWRTAALAGSAATVIAVPNLGALLPRGGEQTDRYDTSITPPDYAFAVWAPIFAGIAAHTVQAVLPSRRATADNAQTAWPLVGAYALNAAWSLAAQTNRFAYTAALLPAAAASAGVAYRRLQRRTEPENLTTVSTGLLLGWTALASVVNLSAVSRLLGADPASTRSIRLSALGSATAAAGLTAVVARSRRGYLALAATSAWGLATTALDRRRPSVVGVGSAVGAASIVGAAVWRRATRR